MMHRELAQLLEQLDELLNEPLVDEDDALELAIVAGLAYRLGASAADLQGATAWREGPGEDLLDEMWEQVDLDPLLEAVDACTEGGMSDEEVEDAVYDVDDVIAAAVWAGRIELVRPAARQMASIVRSVPDVFAPVGEIASQMAALPTVAEHLGLYEYWLALADAGRLLEE